jgi:hypothetical protein
MDTILFVQSIMHLYRYMRYILLHTGRLIGVRASFFTFDLAHSLTLTLTVGYSDVTNYHNV